MSKTYVLLGRAGDVIGILPMLYADSLKGERHKLVVAAEFASLLDGVSYVDRVVFDGPHFEIAKACLQSQSVNGEVKCLQIKGPKEQVAEWTWRAAGVTANQTPSFEQEPWRMAGRLNEWGKHPLVFDRRNPEREAALVEKVFPKRRGRKKPVMLVSTGGVSSPFPYKGLLHELLALKFGATYQIVDLERVQADRFFDLLALFERGTVLVATDSGPLHLARAVPSLPVVALTNDKPNLWHGTAWTPNCIWYCRYSDFPDRGTEMLEAIGLHLRAKKRTVSPHIHVWSEYHGKGETSWKCDWSPMPIYLGVCGRDSGNTLQDGKRFPYLKDVIRMAMKKTEKLICLTRPETQATPELLDILSSHDACYAYRIESGTFKPIVDCFSATKDWWKMVLKEVPDLILSKDYFWSHALWAIFKKHGAKDVTGCVYREAKHA